MKKKDELTKYEDKKEYLEDRESMISSDLTLFSNNTNSILFFISVVFSISSFYFSNTSIDNLNIVTEFIMSFIAAFLYPYLRFKNDKTKDLYIELRAVQYLLNENKFFFNQG